MWRLEWIFLLVALCGSAFGQTFDLDKNRVPLMSIDGLWRFHPGDDMRWADPKFDDSSWALLRTDKPWTEQGFPELKGFVWYRFRVVMPPKEQPAGLTLPMILDDYEVYVDGRRVRSALRGRLPSTMWFPLPEATQLRPGDSGPTTEVFLVALRIWTGYKRDHVVSASVNSVAGSLSLIMEYVRAAQASALARTEDGTVDAVISGLVGALVLGLFCLRRKDREYLWFAIILLASAGYIIINNLGTTFAKMSVGTSDLFGSVLDNFSLAAAMLFFQSVFGLRRTALWWTCFIAAASNAILSGIIFGSPPVRFAFENTLEQGLMLPAYFWILTVLIRWAFLRNRDAQLLLVPTLLLFGWKTFFDGTYTLSQFDLISWGVVFPLLNAGLEIGPWRVGLTALFDVIFTASLLAFLIRRFALSRQREERLTADVEAARQVQQILLPEENPTVKGFEIESVYLPAETVSGDFFQHIPDGKDGLLIVTGDVAGKGLAAAMLVSVLVGAIRATARKTSDPKEILDVLNESLRGRRGFATCLVVHIAATGQMRIANAGHIPPYLNGAPLDLLGSLPLGMAVDTEYEVHEFRLASGDALRFVSDGVLEAQDAAGNLLGFERTRELSHYKAQQIAKAAQDFGQKDDITVVAVDFLGVAHAAA